MVVRFDAAEPGRGWNMDVLSTTRGLAVCGLVGGWNAMMERIGLYASFESGRVLYDLGFSVDAGYCVLAMLYGMLM